MDAPAPIRRVGARRRRMPMMEKHVPKKKYPINQQLLNAIDPINLLGEGDILNILLSLAAHGCMMCFEFLKKC